MKLKHLPFLMVILATSACMWGVPKNTAPAITKDTLAYINKTIRQRASDCGDKPDSGCTVVLIKYPDFQKDSLLNDSLRNRLFNLFWPDTTPEADTDLQKYAIEFISVYENSKNKPDVKGRIFTVQSAAKIIRQDSSLVTLQIGGYMFQGGAHGATVTRFLNWDAKTHSSITLNDILIKGYSDKLTTIGDSIFRKDEHLSDTASLARDYFFKDNKFALNSNFLITPLGLRFLYNQYEIKPYAAGQTELVIPYDKIKSLLLPHTVISQYIK